MHSKQNDNNNNQKKKISEIYVKRQSFDYWTMEKVFNV